MLDISSLADGSSSFHSDVNLTLSGSGATSNIIFGRLSSILEAKI